MLEGVHVIVWATGYQFSFPFFNTTTSTSCKGGSTLCDGLLDVYCRKESLVGGGEGECKSFGPLWKRAVSGREPHLMFAGLATAYGNGMVYDWQGMLFASLIGGFLVVSPELVLREAQEEAHSFLAAVGSLMKYLQFTSHFSPLHYLRDLADTLGFDLEEQRESARVLQEIMEQWVAHFERGDFRRVKCIDVTHRILKSRPFNWKLPTRLFKKRRYLICSP